MKNNEIEIREEKGWLGPVAIIWVAYAITCYAVIVIAALITAGVIVAGHLSLPVILAFSLVSGVCCAGFAGPATTLLQENCDPEYPGRVMGIFNSALALGMPIGTAVGGAIAAMTGVQLFFVADGAFMLAVGVFAAFSPSLRSLDGQAGPAAEAKMATTSAQG